VLTLSPVFGGLPYNADYDQRQTHKTGWFTECFGSVAWHQSGRCITVEARATTKNLAGQTVEARVVYHRLMF
jgi:hypothetical protein